MTSLDLLDRFPVLEEKAGWRDFAEAFDNTECIKKRAAAKEGHEGAEQSPAVSELRDLCDRISDYEFYCGPDWLRVGFETFETYEQKVNWLLNAALRLSLRVGTLLEDCEAGERMRAAIQAEVKRVKIQKRGKGERETRMGHEAYLALLGFIEREARLPSKQELNLEAGRRFRVSKRLKFHSPLPHGMEIKTHGIWRVQSCQERHGLPGFDDAPVYYLIELVDCSSRNQSWDDPRWEETTFSKEVVKPFGFSGLPRHRSR